MSEENQLELLFAPGARGVPRPPRSTAPNDAEGNSEFGVFAALGEQISSTTSKLKKIALLADYLHGLLPMPPRLPIAARLLHGRAFAQSDLRTLQVGWAVIKAGVIGAGGPWPSRNSARFPGSSTTPARRPTEALLERTTPQDSFPYGGRRFFR